MKWEVHQGLSLKALWENKGKLDVYIARESLHTYVILAERHDNTAASVTNAYEIYAQQVCEQFGLEPKRCVFFELYVKHERRNGQPHRQYELDVCTPRLEGVDNRGTSWRPISDEMHQAILGSLMVDVNLNDSYKAY